MRRLVYLASVRADLVEILTYIAGESGSIAVAQGFVAQLRERCRELASKPGTLGRARPELHPEIRSVAHKGYVSSSAMSATGLRWSTSSKATATWTAISRLTRPNH